MISTLAQLLIISGKIHGHKEATKVDAEPPPEHYRPYCPECNDEGRDARLPCEGHT